MKSLPHFGVSKPVPVQLLMMAVVLAGIYCGLNMRREFFPETDPEGARVTLPYPGATPQEIEESMARKVEDALANLEEVDEIQTTISEGGGGIIVEFRDGVDLDEGTKEVEKAIDALTDLPDEAEEINVAEFDPNLPTIMLSIAGDADEEVMKRAIRRVRDDLETLPNMGDILISGVREYEIRVDVDSTAMLEQGIALPGVSSAIRQWMSDVPGGAMRTAVGTINVRTMGVTERAEAIRQIVVKATPDGRRVRIDDIADVREEFVDSQLAQRFNGRPAVSLTVFKTGDEDAVDMAEMVRAYAAGRRGEPFPGGFFERLFQTSMYQAWLLGAQHPEQPPGEIATHSDLARFIEGRLNLLMENAYQGGFLIFVTLLLALNVRTAFWVMTGLFTALCGTLMLMTLFGVTLNLLTMFGLLITLGMLEDDAIVVSENIQARYDRGESAFTAAIKGAEQVFWPVVGTVLTTIVAFAPLTLVKGRIGDLLGALPWVVLCSLFVSLIETMLMLPSHMSHSLDREAKTERRFIGRVLKVYEGWRDRHIVTPMNNGYAALIRSSLTHRYTTTAIALAVLIVSIGMVAGKRLPFTFLPESDSETIIVDVRMPIGTPLAETERIVKRIEAAADAQPELKCISAVIGQRQNMDTGLADASASHIAQVFIELVPVEDRNRESSQLITAIRDALGPVDDAEEVRYSEISGGPGGADITVRISGEDSDEADLVASKVKTLLADFEGLHDIADDNYDTQRELHIELLPGSAALGFTVTDVAQQVRGMLFGLDAHVFSDRREDIDVRVRVDEVARERLASVDRMWVISPAGNPVPLSEIANLKERSGYSTIRRIDRQRAITVTADAAHGTNPEGITESEAFKTGMETVRAAHPHVHVELAGRQADLADAFASLPIAFSAAMLMIYVILAWLFSSYTQPLAVMLAIPFGIVGVVWGHLLMGYQLTFLSLIGYVALSGVVVNNSLIYVEFMNEKRVAGASLREALIEAGRQRLRPIALTTITTFFGLMPLVLETSFQAKFLIPMAIAISFGLVSSTLLTLCVLPCILVIIDDVKEMAHFLWHGLPRSARATPVDVSTRLPEPE